MLKIKAHWQLYTELKKKHVPLSIVDIKSPFYREAVNGICEELLTPSIAADLVVENVYRTINDNLAH